MSSNELENKSQNFQIGVLIVGLVLLLLVSAIILKLLSIAPVGAAGLLSSIWIIIKIRASFYEYSAWSQQYGSLFSFILIGFTGFALVSFDVIIDLLVESETTIFEGSSVILRIIGISRTADLPDLYAGLILLAIQITLIQIVDTIIKLYWEAFGELANEIKNSI